MALSRTPGTTGSRPELSILIVNWKTRALLRACLASLRDYPPALSHEILVADNASGDGSAAMVAAEFPTVRLFANTTNLGYAAGNNQLLRVAQGRLWLLLNPDIEIRPELGVAPFDALADHLARHPACGAVAAKLVQPDGQTQQSCRGFPHPLDLITEWSGLARRLPRAWGQYRLWAFDHEHLRTVDQPMAACLLLRAAVARRVGLFDEQFPIFFNDVDLAWRFYAGGWRIDYLPAAAVLHHGGSSTRQVRPRMIRTSRDSLLAFYAKHYRTRLPNLIYRLTTALIRLAFWWRLRGEAPADSPATGGWGS